MMKAQAGYPTDLTDSQFNLIRNFFRNRKADRAKRGDPQEDFAQ